MTTPKTSLSNYMPMQREKEARIFWEWRVSQDAGGADGSDREVGANNEWRDKHDARYVGAMSAAGRVHCLMVCCMPWCHSGWDTIN